MAQPKNGFLFYQYKLNQIGKDSKKNFPKFSTLKETNNTNESYAIDSQNPKETIKQLAVRIETLVRTAYSLNTHDYKNTKMTEILMMTLTPQSQKIVIKKRASHPFSIQEPNIDFGKLVE